MLILEKQSIKEANSSNVQQTEDQQAKQTFQQLAQTLDNAYE
jgi:hypothetical protein